jgi:hypothetical protein
VVVETYKACPFGGAVSIDYLPGFSLVVCAYLCKPSMQEMRKYALKGPTLGNEAGCSGKALSMSGERR